MASQSYSTVITVKEDKREGGYWVLFSEDLPGLLLCGKDLSALRADTPTAIQRLFQLNYRMEVMVHPVADSKTLRQGGPLEGYQSPALLPQAWAAVPLQH